MLAEEKLVEEIEVIQPLEPSSLLVVAAAELVVFILRVWRTACDRPFPTCNTIDGGCKHYLDRHQSPITLLLPWTDPHPRIASSGSAAMLAAGCYSRVVAALRYGIGRQ